MADEMEVTKVFAVLTLAWPNYKPKDGTIEVYASVLEDIPANVLLTAAKHLIATGGEFFPSASMLRNAALDIITNKRGLPTPYEAWEEVIRMGDGSPVKGLVEVDGGFAVTKTERTWKHPLIERTAVRCGWPEFPNPDPDKLSYDRTVFIKAYECEMNRDQEDQRLLPEVKHLTASVKRLAEGRDDIGCEDEFNPPKGGEG